MKKRYAVLGIILILSGLSTLFSPILSMLVGIDPVGDGFLWFIGQLFFGFVWLIAGIVIFGKRR